MESQQHKNSGENVVQDGKDGLVQGKQQKQQVPVFATSPASPPSQSSSPSHDFSFTISLHHSSSNTQVHPGNKSKPAGHTSFAVDLSPADDIFFHGHLLPLHLLSHLPASPRTSTNSMDSFTLPIRELLDDPRPIKENSNCSTSNGSLINRSHKSNDPESENGEKQGRNKGKTFSLFGWRKGCEVRNREEEEDNNNNKEKKKVRFDVSHVLKRYARMVRPLLFFKGRRENLQFHRKAYSFSGNNLSWRNKRELRGRRGEYSAPASIRTSPTNSGLLVATATLPSSTSDSTMEELQAAIQAAIAHCKNSIAAEEKIK